MKKVRLNTCACRRDGCTGCQQSPAVLLPFFASSCEPQAALSTHTKPSIYLRGCLPDSTPETLNDEILRRKAAALRKRTGDEQWHAPKDTIPLKELYKTALTKVSIPTFTCGCSDLC